MAEKSIIAEFAIEGMDALISDTASLIRKQQELKAELKNVDKTTVDGSKIAAAKTAELKSLNQTINAGTKVIQANTATNKTLDVELNRGIKSIDQARASNTELLKIRNRINITTEEGKLQLDAANKKLDENNAFIKENVSAYEQQKIGIGDYKEQIKGALNELNPLNGGMTGFIARSKEAGGVLPLVGKGLKSVTSGIFGIVKASLAFLATPIGAVIGAVGLVLGLLVNYLKSTQAGMDALTKVTRPLSAIFQSLLGVAQKLGGALVDAFSNPKQSLEDLGNFVKQNLINRFTAFSVILDGILNLDFKKVSNGVLQVGTGVENSIDKINGLAKETGEFFQDAIDKGIAIDKITKETERGENNLILLRSEQNRIIKEQNKIAEDVTKTIAEREAAALKVNDASNLILETETKQLDLLIKKGEIQNSLNDTSLEDQKAQNELIAQRNDAATRQAEIQTTNQNKLNAIRKSGIDAAKKAADNAIKQQNDELANFIANQGFKEKSLEQQLEIDKQVAEKSIAILDAELKAKKISQTEYDTERLNIQNELLQSQAEIAVQNADLELEAYINKNQSKIDNEKFFTEKLLLEEQNRLDLLAEKQLENQALRLENGVISETEYNAAINEINEENRIAKEEAETLREEAKKEKELIDLENKRIIQGEINAFDLKALTDNLKKEEEAELKAAEESGANTKLITDKYNKLEVDLKQQVAEQKLAIAADTLGSVANLLGKESDAGKAVAVAQALINTYLGITAGVKLGFPAAIPAVLAATTTGFGAVKNITATKTPTAETGGLISNGALDVSGGGLLRGRRHSKGGTLIEAEDNEFISSRKTTAMFLPELQRMQAIANGNTGIIRNGFARDGGLTSRTITRSIRQPNQQQTIRVINVASDTAEVAAEDAILVENANL